MVVLVTKKKPSLEQLIKRSFRLIQSLETYNGNDFEVRRTLFVKMVASFKSVRAEWARLQSFAGMIDKGPVVRREDRNFIDTTSLGKPLPEISSLQDELSRLSLEYRRTRAKLSHTRIVFADIEQVLTSFRTDFRRLCIDDELYQNILGSRSQFDPSSLHLLTQLCRAANAKLVVKSNKRFSNVEEPKRLVEVLIDLGFDGALLHPEWIVPVGTSDCRWQEMSNWVSWSSTNVALILTNDAPPLSVSPLLAKKAMSLLVDPLEGFGARDYLSALEYFDSKPHDLTFSRFERASGAVRRYPTLNEHFAR